MAHNIRKYIVVKDPESDMAKEEKRRINRNTFLAQGRKKKLKIVRGELFSLFSFVLFSNAKKKNKHFNWTSLFI